MKKYRLKKGQHPTDHILRLAVSGTSPQSIMDNLREVVEEVYDSLRVMGLAANECGEVEIGTDQFLFTVDPRGIDEDVETNRDPRYDHLCGPGIPRCHARVMELPKRVK